MIESYILRQDMEARYSSAFSRYAVFLMYGNDIIMGDDIEPHYEDIEGD